MAIAGSHINNAFNYLDHEEVYIEERDVGSLLQDLWGGGTGAVYRWSMVEWAIYLP